MSDHEKILKLREALASIVESYDLLYNDQAPGPARGSVQGYFIGAIGPARCLLKDITPAQN